MRFAFVATSVAAVVAVPLALAATGPQMTSDEFLSAVRCTAYVNATNANADLAAEKLRLNSEALAQPAETAALARAEARQIAFEAAKGDPAARSACDQQLVTSAESQNAV
jgi:hypothetical protein